MHISIKVTKSQGKKEKQLQTWLILKFCMKIWELKNESYYMRQFLIIIDQIMNERSFFIYERNLSIVSNRNSFSLED